MRMMMLAVAVLVGAGCAHRTRARRAVSAPSAATTVPPVAAQEVAAPSAGHDYGGAILSTGLLSTAALAGGFLTAGAPGVGRQEEALAVGIGTMGAIGYVWSGPLIHLGHGKLDRGVANLVRNVALATAFGMLGALVAAPLYESNPMAAVGVAAGIATVPSTLLEGLYYSRR